MKKYITFRRVRDAPRPSTAPRGSRNETFVLRERPTSAGGGGGDPGATRTAENDELSRARRATVERQHVRIRRDIALLFFSVANAASPPLASALSLERRAVLLLLLSIQRRR